MHSWGDENVDWHGLNEAPYFIGDWLRRWTRMSVSDMKEKFGTVRVYCSFGWSSFYHLWRPQYMWVPKWWPWSLDLAISGHIMPVLNKIVVPIQTRAYVWRYKKAVQKWPHLYNEIVSGADWGELFDGKVPGYKHSNYWTEVK